MSGIIGGELREKSTNGRTNKC